jgi:hypothetical protein
MRQALLIRRFIDNNEILHLRKPLYFELRQSMWFIFKRNKTIQKLNSPKEDNQSFKRYHLNTIINLRHL